jgi:hypothetical protein
MEWPAVGAGRQARGLESCRGACRYPRGWAGRRRNVPTQGLLAGLRQVRSGSHKGVPARGAGAEFKRDGPAAAPIQTRRGGRLTNPVELLRASLPQHDLHQRRQVLEQVVVDAPPELGGLGLGRLGLAVAWGAAGRGRGGWGRGRAGRVGRRRRGPNAAAGGRVTPGGRGADRGDSVTDRRRRRGRGGGGRRRARRARARRAAGAARPRGAPPPPPPPPPGAPQPPAPAARGDAAGRAPARAPLPRLAPAPSAPPAPAAPHPQPPQTPAAGGARRLTAQVDAPHVVPLPREVFEERVLRRDVPGGLRARGQARHEQHGVAALGGGRVEAAAHHEQAHAVGRRRPVLDSLDGGVGVGVVPQPAAAARRAREAAAAAAAGADTASVAAAAAVERAAASGARRAAAGQEPAAGRLGARKQPRADAAEAARRGGHEFAVEAAVCGGGVARGTGSSASARPRRLATAWARPRLGGPPRAT